MPTTAIQITSYSDIFKQYVKEAWPNLTTRIIELATDFIAMSMLANISEEALSATPIISSSQIVLRSVNATFLYYTGVKTSIAFGENKKESTGNILKASWLFAAGLSIPAVGLAYFSAPILKALDQPESVADIAQEYLRAFAYGLPLTLMSISNQQVMLGLKQPLTVLAVTALTRPLALAIGYCFMHGLFELPKLGVASLGYGNSISYALNFALSVAIFALSKKFRECNMLNVSRKEIFAAFSELVKKGVPIGAYASVELGSLLFSTILIGGLGSNKLASLQPALQYSSFLANTTFTLASTTGIIVSRNVAKQQFQNAKRFGNVSNVINFTLPVLVLAAFFAIGNDFMSPFISSHDVLSLAYILLVINLVGQIADGPRNSSTGILRGYGDTTSPMVINLLTMLLINAPLACVSSLVLKDAKGVLFSRSLAIGISAVAIFIKQMFTSHTTEIVATSSPAANKPSTEHCWQFFKNKKSKAGTERQPLLVNQPQDNTSNSATRWSSCTII